MVVDVDKLWSPGDNLNICFMNGTTGQKEVLMEVIEEWTDDLDISFNLTEDINSEIRVAFGNLLFASIGRDALEVPQELPTLQVSDLGRPSNLKKFARHEFGHVLGCLHEHQSPKFPFSINEEFVISKYTSLPYGWTMSLVKYNFFKKMGEQIVESEFDPLSIMIYELSSREIIEGRSFSYNEHLSSVDKHFINRFYKKIIA